MKAQLHWSGHCIWAQGWPLSLPKLNRATLNPLRWSGLGPSLDLPARRTTAPSTGYGISHWESPVPFATELTGASHAVRFCLLKPSPSQVQNWLSLRNHLSEKIYCPKDSHPAQVTALLRVLFISQSQELIPHEACRTQRKTQQRDQPPQGKFNLLQSISQPGHITPRKVIRNVKSTSHPELAQAVIYERCQYWAFRCTRNKISRKTSQHGPLLH